MTAFKILFLGTSPFALPSLKLLAENFTCLSVVTRPDRPAGRGKPLTATPVKLEALKYNLELFQPEGHEDLMEVLRLSNPHLVVNVAYGMFLKEDVLNFPPLGCINLHPSLLPAYRGAAPIQRAIMAGEETTGVTVLYMTPRLDAGDIILQEKTYIDPEETYGMLHDRLAEMGSKVLLKAIYLLKEGKAPRHPQDETKVTYAPLITKEEELILWTRPALSLHNQVRALNPSPGAYTRYRQRRLKIWRTSVVEKNDEAPLFPPGTICQVGKDFVEVAAGRNLLKIQEVQLESKKKMEMEEFLKGHPLKVGDRFA